MVVIFGNELDALKFNLQRLMSEKGKSNSEGLQGGNKQRRLAELSIKSVHSGCVDYNIFMSPVFLFLESTVEAVQQKNKVHFRKIYMDV